MTDHFDKKKLGEIVAIRGGKRLPKGAFLQLEPNSHPYIRVRDMGYRKINRENLEFVPDHVFPSIKSYTVEKDDVLISIVGTVGLISIVDEYFHRSSQTENCAKLTGLTPIDAKYLYYFLSSQEGQSQIRTNTVGAVQPKLPLYGIANIDVTWPRESIRMLVARYLEHLDDKIELNRQLNQTLESMAQALFKSWFVDFDPVIDNAIAAGNPIPEPFQARAERRRLRLYESVPEGQSPLQPLPAELRQLFPNSFQETEEFGWVPEGWRAGKLGDILQLRNERIDAGIETEGIPYVPIECITSKSLFLADSKSGYEANSSLIKFYKGDILFGAMRPYFHKVCVAPFEGTTRTTVFVLQPIRGFDFAYSLLTLNQEGTVEYATTISVGTTIPYAKWENSFEKMPVLLPPDAIKLEFNSLAFPFIGSISSKYFENKSLAEMRDTLLPKLLSGKFRIPDAEAQISEAGL